METEPTTFIYENSRKVRITQNPGSGTMTIEFKHGDATRAFTFRGHLMYEEYTRITA